MKRQKIEEEIDFIKSKSINGYADKFFICEHFGFSHKTCERRFSAAGIKHMDSKLIEMMIDIENSMPSIEVARKYGFSLENVNQFSRRHSLKNRYQYRHKNYSDPYFFDNIDTSEKSYILGFIAADGHVSDKEIKICLSSKDEDILVKIKNTVGFKNNIRKFKSTSSLSKRGSEYAVISFGTKEMINSLKCLGFSNKKTVDLSVPNVDKDFLIDFYRGLVDGDGSFGKYLHNDGYYRYSFSLCGTMPVLKSFIEYFSNFGIKFSNSIRKRFNTEDCCFSISVTGKENVLKLLDLLYSNAGDSLFLDRKYKNYLNIKM